MKVTSVTRIGASLLAASVLWIGTADAQVKYYARERLSPMVPTEGPVEYGEWSLSPDYVPSKSCGGVGSNLPNVAEAKRTAVCSTSTCDPLRKPVEPVKQTGCAMACSGSSAQPDVAPNQIYNATMVRAIQMPASATTPAQRLAAAVSYCNAFVPDVNFRALGCYSTTTQIGALITTSSALEYSTRSLAGAYLMTCTVR
jgi:hypothetical protein